MAISIDTIAGLDPKINSRLRAVGIEHIDQLLARGASLEGRGQLMSATGLSEADIQRLLDAAAKVGGASAVGVYGTQATTEEFAARKVGVYEESTPPPAPARRPAPAAAPMPAPASAPAPTVEERRGFPWWLLLLPLLLLALAGLFWWLSQRQQVATTIPAAIPTAGATVGATVAPTVGATVAPAVGATVGATVAPTVVPTAVPAVVPTIAPTAVPTVAATVPPIAAIPEIKPLSGGTALVVGATTLIEGKGTPGAILELLDGDTVVSTTTVDGNGNWLFAYTPTNAGARTLSVREKGTTTAATVDVTVEDVPTASVNGAVVGIDPTTLPGGALLRIQLADVTGSDSAPLIAEQLIPLNGQAAPFPFKLVYDPRRIKPENDYNVQGNIIDAAGTMLYTTNKEFLVVTKGRPSSEVEVTMVPAS